MKQKLSKPAQLNFNLLPTIFFCLLAVVGLTAINPATARAQIGTGIYTGVEISSGISDSNNSMIWGNSFALNSFGEWESHHLSYSVNYQTNPFVPNNHIVSDGTWTLVVFRENQYAGSLFGTISGGTVQFTPSVKAGLDADVQQTQINLRTTGGLGIFEGRKSGDIIGTLNATTDLTSSLHETNGILPLAF